MFDLSKHVGPYDVGYKLVIVYNALQKKYYVTGYTQRPSMGGSTSYIESSADGATLEFNSMQEVLDSLTKYYEHDKEKVF